jgi:hypothetical protein
MLIIYFREEQGRLRRDGVWGLSLKSVVDDGLVEMSRI